MPEPKRNLGVSVRARLLNLSKERGQTFDLLLTRYAHERLLYRLGTGPHRERFARRKTAIPAERPHGLTRAFADEPEKQRLWKSFAGAIGQDLPPLNEVIEQLGVFLMPRVTAVDDLPTMT